MNLEDKEVEIKTTWRSTGKKLPLWSRLWARLLIAKKEPPTSTREITDDGELKSGSDTPPN